MRGCECERERMVRGSPCERVRAGKFCEWLRARACVRSPVCGFVCACACMRACMQACVCVCARARENLCRLVDVLEVLSLSHADKKLQRHLQLRALAHKTLQARHTMKKQSRTQSK